MAPIAPHSRRITWRTRAPPHHGGRRLVREATCVVQRYAADGASMNELREAATLEVIIEYAQEIQRATSPGDAHDCARHIEDQARAALAAPRAPEGPPRDDAEVEQRI